MSSGLFYRNSLDQPISNIRVSGLFLLLCFKEIPVVNANSEDSDQMLHSAPYDLGLHCFVNYPFGGLQTKMG